MKLLHSNPKKPKKRLWPYLLALGKRKAFNEVEKTNSLLLVHHHDLNIKHYLDKCIWRSAELRDCKAMSENNLSINQWKCRPGFALVCPSSAVPVTVYTQGRDETCTGSQRDAGFD